MAVSWRIVVFLAAIVLFGFLYVTLDVPVQDPIEPTASEQSDSVPANNFLDLLREGWALAPFAFLLAGALWLIRESVWVSGGG